MSWPFIQAVNYTPANRTSVDWIVIHSMEVQKRSGVAKNVAAWFAGDSAPKASAHYCVDNEQIYQCVKETDIAWHAPGANQKGIGVELAGQASDTWDDQYANDVISNGIKLVSDLADRWNIPKVVVLDLDLAKGVRGITTHAEVSKAFKLGNHWDPGPNFPLQDFVARL